MEEVGRNPGRLKIGFLTRIPEGWSDRTQLHPDCENAVKDAARLCEGLGHTVEEVAPGPLSHPNLPATFGFIFSCFLGHAVAYWEKELGKKIKQEDLEPITWGRYQGSLTRPGGDYLFTVEEVQRFSRKIARWYHEGGYDLLLTPTMTIPPTKLGSFQSTPDEPMKWLGVALGFLAFTRVQNMTGQPAMSVPLFWNQDNIPIGVQFAGRFGEEATLFRLASQLEQARPWKDRKPSMHCSNE